MAFLLFFLLLFHPPALALPDIDWSSLGPVALLGAFSALSLFRSNHSDPIFQPSIPARASLFQADSSPLSALRLIGQSSSNGSFLALCLPSPDSLLIAGSFDSINNINNTRNVALYDSRSNSFSPLALGLDGLVHSIDCSVQNRFVFAGRFPSPVPGAPPNLAIWNSLSASWASDLSPLPLSSLPSSLSLTSANLLSSSAGQSLLLAGNLHLRVASDSPLPSNLSSSLSEISAGQNSSNPYLIGTSLAPVLLSNSSSWVGSPSNPAQVYNSPAAISCPSGSDGQPNSTWELDPAYQSGLLTLNLGRSVQARGIRLGNSFANGGGTAGFHIVSIPDNQVLPLTFLDPITNRLAHCQMNCTLSRDLKIVAQDYLFSEPVQLSGVQLVITSKFGSVAGLHLFQILSSGNAAYADQSLNSDQACTSGIGSTGAPNSARTTGDWSSQSVNSQLPGTLQSVLSATASPGTTPDTGPTLTWSIHVPQLGQYELWFESPGCANMGDCNSRTNLSLSVSPSNGLVSNTTTIVDSRNRDDQSILIYNGTLNAQDQLPVTLRLAATVTPGSDPVSIVADHVTLRSIEVDRLINLTSSGLLLHGLYECVISGTGAFGDGAPVAATLSSGTPNNISLTAVDRLGLAFKPTSFVRALATDNTTVFAATQLSPNLTLIGVSTGSTAVPNGGGFNGQVHTLWVTDRTLYAGGNFTATIDGSVLGLAGIAKWSYSEPNSVWQALGGGQRVGSPVNVIRSFGEWLYVLGTSDHGNGYPALGVYNLHNSSWAHSGLGFLDGNLTAISVQRAANSKVYIAGNLEAVGDLEVPAGAFLSTPSSLNEPPTVKGLGFEMNQTASLLANSTFLTHSAISSSRTLDSASRQLESSSPRLSPRAEYSTLPQPLRSLQPRQVSKDSIGVGVLNVSLPYALTSNSQASILTGAFWKNDYLLLGGRFVTMDSIRNIGLYDIKSSTLKALNGSRTLEGEVLTIKIVGDLAWIGGDFVSPSGRLGLDTYNLATGSWATRSMAGLGAYPQTNVSVRAIKSRSDGDVIIAGKFEQLGSLPCQSICLWSSTQSQWTSLGNGLRGVVNHMEFLGKSLEELIVTGRFDLNSSLADVSIAKWNFDGDQPSWNPLGDQSHIPGPIRTMAVGEKGSSESDGMFVGGDLANGVGSFLMRWDGSQWSTVPGISSSSAIEQSYFVPLRDPSTSISTLNGVKSDRMLMVSGLIELESHSGLKWGSVLYDGSNWFPYLTALDSSGKNGVVAQLVSVTEGFRSAVRHIHSVAAVILISMAISFAIVFLAVLTGVLIGLRKKAKENNQASNLRDSRGTMAGGAGSIATDDDDGDGGPLNPTDCPKPRRPTSLLATIDAATAGMVSMKGGINSSDEKSSLKKMGMDPDQRSEKDLERHVDPEGVGEEYVEVQEDDAEDDEEGEGGRVDVRRARWSFEPQLPGEIAVGAGESVEVRDRSNQEWWLVRRADGVEGVVPADWFL